MSNLFEALGFSLSSLADFEDAELARHVVKRLLTLPKNLAPEKCSAFEPVDQPLDPSDPESAVRLWLNPEANARNKVRLGEAAGSLMLESSKKAAYHVDWQKAAQPSFAYIGGNAPLNLLRSEPRMLMEFVNLSKELAVATQAVYGEVRNMSFKGWDAPMDLVKRLPDIPWASVYGELYISLFGRQRVLNAPFHRIEELPSGALWLEASASPFEQVSEEAKARIRQHLGEDAFMSGGRWRYTDGRAPRFESPKVGP